MASKILYFLSRLVILKLLRIEVKGLENLEGLKPPLIFAVGPHKSYIDGPVCFAITPKEFLPVRFPVASEYFNWVKNPIKFPASVFIALILRLTSCVPVQVGKIRGVREVIKFLDTNGCLWIFPEGGISKGWNTRPLKSGVMFVHQVSKAPVIPIGISGSEFNFFKYNLFKRQKIVIRFGKPLPKNFSKYELRMAIEKLLSP